MDGDTRARRSRGKPVVIDEHHIGPDSDRSREMDRVERTQGDRRDSRRGSRNRPIHFDERTTVEYACYVRHFDLVDETRHPEAPRDLGDGDDARHHLGLVRDDRDESEALGLADDELDQSGSVGVDDARSDLPCPRR